MSRKLGALVLVMLLSVATLAQGRGDSGYLIIRRAPNFGAAQWLQIWIDGEKLDPVAFGHDFRGPISAGHHVIAFHQSDERWPTPPNRISINVEPGRTYDFTAFFYSEQVYLKPNR